LAGQVVLLVILAGTVGLGAAGWAVGLAYGLVVCGLLQRGLSGSGAGGSGAGGSGAGWFGPADWVTAVRAALVGGVAALTVDGLWVAPRVGVLVPMAAVALVLDGVDGTVARRTGTVSGFGARFDMEVDSFLLLVLSVGVARTAGGWVLVFGAMRYLFGGAGWLLPWLAGRLPPRFWRKVVAATQGVVMVVVAAGVLPAAVAVGVLVVALAMLVESFGRDVRWLWRRRGPRPVAGAGRRMPVLAVATGRRRAE
jgi:phosphatidylglycerophosphate synthase